MRPLAIRCASDRDDKGRRNSETGDSRRPGRLSALEVQIRDAWKWMMRQTGALGGPPPAVGATRDAVHQR